MATKKKTAKRNTIPGPQIDPEFLTSTLNTILVRLNTLNQRVFNLETQMKETASNQSQMQELVMKEMRSIEACFKETKESAESAVLALQAKATSCEPESEVN